MGSVPQITPNSIKKVTGIDRRPVYFINMSSFGAPSITVKGETRASDGEISIKWGSKMMKNVNSSKVDTDIMNPTEIVEFKRAARQFLANEPAKLQPLTEDLIWVKMPYLKNLSDADVWKKNAQGNYYVTPESVKTLFKRFTDPKMWQQLGKVIAVDVFNGNGDRFNTSGDWVNQGNLMFQSRLGGPKVIGLDTFESQGANSNLTKPGDLTKLDVLRGGQATKTFALNVCKGVAMETNRAIIKAGLNTLQVKAGNHKITINPNTDTDYLDAYADDLEAGIKAGVLELKQYLEGKVDKYKQQKVTVNPLFSGPNNPAAAKAIPAGVIARMQSLGWRTT